MLRKSALFSLVLLMFVIGLVPSATSAQAITTTWSTSITYYTPSDTEGKLQIEYYAEGSDTPIKADSITMAPHKAGSLYIGNVPGITDSFSGGAVLSADVPIVATAVNIGGKSYPRALYSGFDPSLASKDFFIPTVLYQKFNTTSLVSIQNIESTSIEATLKVYPVGSSTPAFEHTYSIPAQSAKLISTGDMGLAAGFTGSAVVTANGKVVAAVQENSTNGPDAKAFEGVASNAGASTLYMASMACRAYGAQQQTSYYAIQNVGTTTATVEIDFYSTDGTKLYTASGINIGPNSKASVNPCQYVAASSNLEGQAGSAVIRSTNSQPLIAIGKMNSSKMTATAFLGETSGSKNVAAAYIRWMSDATKGERANVAIMNVGTEAAKDIKVIYYDNQGHAAATHTLAAASSPLGRYIKVNTNPEAASALDTDGNFGVNPYGGAIEVRSDQPVVVVVRLSKVVSFSPGKFTEDYNGTSVAP